MKPQEIHIGGRQEVNPATIKLMKADVNYTLVCFYDGSKVIVATTLGIIENRMPEGSFLRVSRGLVINRNSVSKYFVRSNYDEIKLTDASFIKVSRRRREEMRKLFINPSI